MHWHDVPWVGSYKRAFDDEVRELYDTNTDWTRSKNFAKETRNTNPQPQKQSMR
ncbi:MAG TPA: hypothetical protein VFR18_19575 [Terriglobia bacterium]|nr:hypothetical protein [Terriglobia bacterium]